METNPNQIINQWFRISMACKVDFTKFHFSELLNHNSPKVLRLALAITPNSCSYQKMSIVNVSLRQNLVPWLPQFFSSSWLYAESILISISFACLLPIGQTMHYLIHKIFKIAKIFRLALYTIPMLIWYTNWHHRKCK